MNEEFYSIGRGSLNINGKFYYGLDYEITDFMRSLEEENQKLKEQINNLECLIESIKLEVTLNQEQEKLLDNIMFRSDKQ